MSDKDNSNDVLVKFTDVTKQYGDLVVLDKLNLEIKKNEMVVFPDPDGPIIETISFFLISKLSLSKTIRSPYCFVTLENFTKISSELFI